MKYLKLVAKALVFLLALTTTPLVLGVIALVALVIVPVNAFADWAWAQLSE